MNTLKDRIEIMKTSKKSEIDSYKGSRKEIKKVFLEEIVKALEESDNFSITYDCLLSRQKDFYYKTKEFQQDLEDLGLSVTFTEYNIIYGRIHTAVGSTACISVNID